MFLKDQLPLVLHLALLLDEVVLSVQGLEVEPLLLDGSLQGHLLFVDDLVLLCSLHFAFQSFRGLFPFLKTRVFEFQICLVFGIVP